MKTKMMKKINILLLGFCCVLAFGQSKTSKKKPSDYKIGKSSQSNTVNLPVVNENIPLLIPKKIKGKSGFVNQ